MNYRTLVGLEIHAELLTESKMFCTCSTTFGGEVNTHCCPICIGLPGTLPVINKRAIEFAIMAGLSANCKIAQNCKMDRKNYFYPDLPKAYQISQYDMPICTDGYMEIETESGVKKIGIERIHMEEDTGKSLHTEDGSSLLNYNRCGVPLIEVVSRPDMASAAEATAFLEKLKAILEYIEVSDVKMEQGSLRCDVNVNVVADDGRKTEIAEIKNLNSFKAAAKAIEHETARHIEALEDGGNTLKDTRRWDDAKGITVSMRSKEYANDYRYFPEPDLVEMEISEEWIERIRKELPELPEAKKERFVKEYGIPVYDAGVIVSSKALAAFYEDSVSQAGDAKLASNFIMTEVLRRLKDTDADITDMPFDSTDFANLLKFVIDGTVSNNMAKKVLREMAETGKKPEKVIEEKGMKQITDESAIEEIVVRVISENPQSIEDYRNGKDRALGFLVGQVMKASKGKAAPQTVNRLIRDKLSSL
jgi:aspartyl-tRNA(Asn)/glutamyl-tRNA(Gln) amidotransferase subunit B